MQVVKLPKNLGVVMARPSSLDMQMRRENYEVVVRFPDGTEHEVEYYATLKEAQESLPRFARYCRLAIQEGL